MVQKLPPRGQCISMLGFSSVSTVNLPVTSIITGKREGHIGYQLVKTRKQGMGSY